MKILWDELEYLRSTPTSSCPVVYTCALNSTIKKFKELEYVICFLEGLNESYSNVRSTILNMDPLPPINKVYAMANQQEALPSAATIESTAFTVAPGNSQGRGQQA